MVVVSADRLGGCLSKPPKLTMRDGGKSDRTIGEWSADDGVFQRESCGVRHNDPGLPASDYNSPLSQRLFVCIALIAMSKSPITCHGTLLSAHVVSNLSFISPGRVHWQACCRRPSVHLQPRRNTGRRRIILRSRLGYRVGSDAYAADA